MKLAFIYDATIPQIGEIGAALEKKYGTCSVYEADAVVPVGGDQTLLRVLPDAKGKLVYGFVPADSNSVGYNLNRHTVNDDLPVQIVQSRTYDIYPLNLKVNYQDGTSELFTVFSAVTFSRNSGQAALLSLTGTFNNEAQSLRVCGDGIAFSTPLGAGAENFSNHGPMLARGDKTIVMTPMGVGTPRGMCAVVSNENTRYAVENISPDKRAMRLDIDGKSLEVNAAKGKIMSLEISIISASHTKIGIRTSLHPFKRLTI